MLHNYCILHVFLHNFPIFHQYFCTISVFFTCISAQFLYFSPTFRQNYCIFICVSHQYFSIPTSGKQLYIFLKYIPQPYFSTVFRNCILQVYFTSVFPHRWKAAHARLRGCRVSGYRVPGSEHRPLTGLSHWPDEEVISGSRRLFLIFMCRLVNLCYSFICKVFKLKMA